MTNAEVLKKAFGVLTLDELDNLRFHLQKKTPILCGGRAAYFLDGAGAG